MERFDINLACKRELLFIVKVSSRSRGLKPGTSEQ